ncbi:MAG: PH domain-containing protein [Oligoflexia bacterium]|nr:PH domain-containing protein [Oligoflexia bacterium]
MAISLRTNEKVMANTDFHWFIYIGPVFWMILCTITSIGMFTDSSNGPYAVYVLLLGAGPFAYKYLSNVCKDYVLTNERLYLENGILAKSKKDIPLNKINDVELHQSLIQRIFGCGNLIILTGNDKPHVMKNIAKPELFKNNVSQIIHKGVQN